VGTGNMLVRAIFTLLALVEAEEVWVVAAAPVTTRTRTKARTMCFMEGTPCISLIWLNLWCAKIRLKASLGEGLASTHTAGVGITGRACRHRQHAGAGDIHLVGLGGGGRGLGGCSGTGEDENEDEGADDIFHGVYP
jgi:hypothetical protein